MTDPHLNDGLTKPHFVPFPPIGRLAATVAGLFAEGRTAIDPAPFAPERFL